MPSQPAPDVPRYPIRVAARRAGLGVDTLRAWERRHTAVQPSRTEGGQRLYTDADIERLALLRTLTERGHALTGLTALSLPELHALARAEQESAGEPMPAVRGEPERAPAPVTDRATSAFLDAAVRAVRTLDATELHRLLLRAMVEDGPEEFLASLVAPLCTAIGSLWEREVIGVAEEHVASATLRQALGFLLQTLQAPDDAPAVVVATPQGERHEFGAMMAGAIAALAGARVVYVGPDLPARDIAAAARRARARLVALSIVRGGQARRAAAELEALRASLPRSTHIVVGGAGAEDLTERLESLGARCCTSWSEWRLIVGALSGGARPPRRAA